MIHVRLHRSVRPAPSALLGTVPLGARVRDGRFVARPVGGFPARVAGYGAARLV
jgi:hypothetical protein